ncbi:hypothetical protein CAMRE0001_0142 [Campylobacter rectus RM3267]|uniref:Uncharacterized protein n=2 Tax=Campylobacter rectus TaxID=203 RepID=A0A6G5QJF5_CAMRE|nr:hypothetical protein [Campylobacter rectus]EEF15375.1 hypothetical protein CAMRE0001_0142 [Campylobacter rectus RM3267]QCD45828.1 hypothetical protein CRECT_0119 [Campylobacter rectus]UEB48807.1 hypothetical protein LK437_05770 [Campylobacter rectus]
MKSLDEILLSFDKNTQNILFLNGKGAKHPVWDDANEVFAKAVEQILDKSLGLQKGVDYSKTPKFYGARPLAFIGVHAQMIGRKSIGFLLTSRHLLVKFDASAANTDEVAAAFRLDKYLQNELENLAWQELEKCEFEIESEIKAAMKRTLKAVLNAIFEDGVQNDEDKISDKLLELGLGEALKTPLDESKLLSKSLGVFKPSSPIFHSLDRALFGLSKPFGVILDERGLISRDLMEEPVFSSWDEIGGAQIEVKEDAVIIGEKEHKIPFELKEKKENFAEFLKFTAALKA